MRLEPETVFQYGDQWFRVAEIEPNENAEIVIKANRDSPPAHGGEGAAVSEARVKPLEWREPSKSTNGCWTAESALGVYSVCIEGDWYAVRDKVPRDFYFEWCGQDISRDTLETAKAAAQADYEARILSALTATQSAPAPGGWRDILRAVRDAIDLEHAKVIGDDGYNYAAGQEYGLRLALLKIDEALSASPAPEPVADAVAEALREARGAIRLHSAMIPGSASLLHTIDTALAQPAPAAQEAPSGVVAEIARLKEEISKMEDELSEERQTWPEWAKRIYAFMRKLGYYESSEDDIHLPDDLESWFDEALRNAALAKRQPQSQEGGWREALEPFATFAETAVEKTEGGWQWVNLSRDRICDWFGPSDFGLAMHFLSASPAPAPAANAVHDISKWAIDRSTASPILVYDKCSVIQDEQAEYVLGLIRANLQPEDHGQ